MNDPSSADSSAASSVEPTSASPAPPGDPVSDVATTRVVKARFTDATVTVYQAYSPAIAEPAVAAGCFVPPFKRDRMTWIKPSLLWMAHRSGWATKPGQERVLAIEVTRDGFEWALAHSCLSHFDASIYPSYDEWKRQLLDSPVRVQWDPARSIALSPLRHRAIQIGLGAEAVDRYVDDWIVTIEDITDLVRGVHSFVDAGQHDRARMLLPAEEVYPLLQEIAVRIGTGPLG